MGHEGNKGYALFVVLAILALLFVLTTAVSLDVKTETSRSLLLAAEDKALNGADSGAQYALEAVREHQSLPSSYAAASWSLLQKDGWKSTCFKVYENSAACVSGSRCILAYGEVVQGNCGDYPEDLGRVVAARIVEGKIDATNGNLTEWSEVFP